MTDTTIWDDRNVILTIARILAHSEPANPVPHMSCAWSRNAETGRLESHWEAHGTEH